MFGRFVFEIVGRLVIMRGGSNITYVETSNTSSSHHVGILLFSKHFKVVYLARFGGLFGDAACGLVGDSGGKTFVRLCVLSFKPYSFIRVYSFLCKHFGGFSEIVDPLVIINSRQQYIFKQVWTSLQQMLGLVHLFCSFLPQKYVFLRPFWRLSATQLTSMS